MGVILRRPAVRRPPRVSDPDQALERLLLQPVFKITEFAFGAAAREMAILQRGHARGIIAPVFEPLERVDQLHCHRLAAEHADNPAHGAAVSLSFESDYDPATLYDR